MPKDKKPSLIRAKFRRVAPPAGLPFVPTKMMPTMPKPAADTVRVPTFEATSMIERTVVEPEEKPVTKIIGKKKIRIPKKKETE